jgi:tetratricopeptide (TPR) repeat protein
MPIFTKVESFVKQISIFLKKEEYKKAYTLSKEMVDAFPKELMSHFLLAKSAFGLQQYEKTLHEARRAFNMSTERGDMAASALLISTGLFMLERYAEGYSLLKQYDDMKSESIQEMLLIFSAVLGKEGEAGIHARKLMKLNALMAEDLIMKFLERR